MSSRDILWTKEYHIAHSDRFSKIFVSKHADNLFYSSVLYYHKSGSFTASTMTLHMKLKHFMAETEAQAFDQCKNWVGRHLGTDYDLSRGKVVYEGNRPLV